MINGKNNKQPTNQFDSQLIKLHKQSHILDIRFKPIRSNKKNQQKIITYKQHIITQVISR